jgi:hypothetical protein
MLADSAIPIVVCIVLGSLDRPSRAHGVDCRPTQQIPKRRSAMSERPVFIYAATHADRADAIADYDGLFELQGAKLVGTGKELRRELEEAEKEAAVS